MSIYTSKVKLQFVKSSLKHDTCWICKQNTEKEGRSSVQWNISQRIHLKEELRRYNQFCSFFVAFTTFVCICIRFFWDFTDIISGSGERERFLLGISCGLRRSVNSSKKFNSNTSRDFKSYKAILKNNLIHLLLVSQWWKFQ